MSHSQPSQSPRHYDVIIIGAGMSGLGAGIRLAMFNKKVLILEKHSISGGLNSYYSRFKRPFDVGLHAMTNFVQKGNRRSPLGKLIKQLRIPYDQLELQEQFQSKIQFPNKNLVFSNDFNDLTEEIAQNFPAQVDGFIKLTEFIKQYNEVALEGQYISAKEEVKKYLSDPLLIEMIFCPLLIYGSAWENDMDFSQFAIMFKSIYLEGFCRPKGGVRSLLNLLLDSYKEKQGEIEFRHGVQKILIKNNKVEGVLTTKDEVITCNQIISSMGYPETLRHIDQQEKQDSKKIETGRLTFAESIFIVDQKPQDVGFKDTIVFYNQKDAYSYQNPQKCYDNQSAVVCFPNNFAHDDYPEGVIRVTYIADYESWKSLERQDYKQKKLMMADEAFKLVNRILPSHFEGKIICQDIFSPTTIQRYTGHFKGCVYGSPDKSKDGTTPYENLFLCGTDQGFLGIVGALLSGISMANYHSLSN